MSTRRDPGEEAAPAAPALEPPAPLEAATAPAPLSPVARSVVELSRTFGNAAVARALDGHPPDGHPGGKPAAAAALARLRGGVASAPATVAPDVLLQSGDALEPALGAAVATRTPRADVARDPVSVDESAATRAAAAAYDALDGLDDIEAFKAALRGHDADTRWAIRLAFQERYEQTLGTYVLDQLSGDDLIEAAALLEGPNVYADHVALGKALIGAGTREDEVWLLLEGASVEGRRELERKYDAAFGTSSSVGALSMGSLRADLKSDLDEEDAYRAVTLLQRDLTPADRLYLASAATTGTRDDEVVDIVQTAWADGPAGIASLFAGWVKVQATAGVEVPDLDACMEAELSFESWELVKAVLDASKSIGGREVGLLGELDPEAVARAQFEAAFATYAAAAARLGTNEQQADEAVKRMRGLIEARTAENGVDDLVREWQTRLDALDFDDELSGAELQQAEFQRVADLEPADELYLARRGHEEVRALEIIEKAWAAGTVDTLADQCSTERTIGDQVRPAFWIWDSVRVTGPEAHRVGILTNRYDSLVIRGAKRLRHEIEEGSAEGELRRAYAFLQLAAGMQPAVVAEYAARYLDAGDVPANRAFCDHVADRYGGTPLVIDVRNLVDPVSDIADPRARMLEILERGRRRHELSKPGLFFSLPIVIPGVPPMTIGELMHAYDTASGNDVFAVADESLARLEYLALEASDEELAAFAAERGLAPGDASLQEALVAGEYERLEQRLQDVDALVQAVTEGVATAVELGLSAAITVATGGTGAGLFLAALTSAVAGMLVREAALRDRYELTSKENAEKLAVVIASAAFGALGGEVLEGIAAAEKLKAMGRLGAFATDAVTEAFTQVGGAVASSVFADHVPSAEDVAAGALASLVAVLGAGAGGALKHGVDEATRTTAQQLRQRLVANVTQNLISSSGEVGAELAKSGTGRLTAADIMRDAGLKALAAVAAGVTTTLGEHGAEMVGAKADESDEGSEDRAGGEAQGGEGEAPEGQQDEGEAARKRAIDDLASDESGPLPRQAHPDTARYHEGLVEFDLDNDGAERSYAVSIRDQPKDEVGMWRNAATGEFVVVQGAERFVTATWKGDALFAHGRWELVKHYHPGDPKIARFPSRQDFRALRRQLVEQHTSGEEPTGYVRSTIDYVDEHGNRQQTTFGYDMENGYFVQFVGPDGKQHSESFGDEPWRERSQWELYLLGTWDVQLAALPTGGTEGDLGVDKKPRVTTPTPGFFDDVDPTRPASSGVKFTDQVTSDPQTGWDEIRTDIEWPIDEETVATGYIIRAWDPLTRRLEMREAYLDTLPRWIETGGTEMVPGPGGQTHLATYLQLRQMKLLRLEYAELRHATIKDIENVRAICQMEAGRRAGEDPDATVRASHALGYNETALVQSGHRIASAKVHGGKREPFEILLDRLEAETPGLRAKHDAILAEYGIERADHVLYGFDIDLQTVPFNVDESPDGGSEP